MKKTMNIGEAIIALKKGKFVRREGWRDRGMYLYLEEIVFNIVDLKEDADSYTQGAHIVLVDDKGTHQPGWTASTQDLLATDWEL